jgi:hypothetical protein
MKLFDCLSRKNSGISVYGPMSIAACIFLVISFLLTFRLRAYPNNPEARKAIKPQAKWRNAR